MKNHVPDLSKITGVAQISSLLATLLYDKQQYIKGIILFMSNTVYVPHLSTVGVEVSRVCPPPLVSRSVDPVCFNISPLYQIIYSHQFYQLSYYIPHFKQELCKHHVRDPESTRLRKKHLLSSTSSKLTYNLSATNYRYCTIRKCKKNNI